MKVTWKGIGQVLLWYVGLNIAGALTALILIMMGVDI